MMLRCVMAAGLAFFLAAAAPAFADESDHSAWLNVTGNGPVHGRILAWVEVQGRFQDDVSRLRQSIIRPGIGYRVAPKVDLYVGYGRITNHNPGPAQDVGEDRLWQQLSWAGTEIAGGTLSTRTRLEQRWVENGDDTGWRFRQFIKFNRPVKPGADVALVLTSETFVAFDDTDWGARSGFDQMRNFAGVGFSVAPKARIEAGYMNQYINRPGSNDRMNHIASANLFIRF